MSHASVLVAVDVVNPTDHEEIKAAVTFQMAPYDENDEFFRDGSRWDWWQIGGRFTGAIGGGADIIQVKHLNLEAIRQSRERNLREAHRMALAERSNFPLELIYGFNPHEVSEDEYVASRMKSPISTYAFLRNHHWHEGERLGWWGATVKTECEIKAGDDPNVLTRRCLTTGDENAKIIVWNEPHDIWCEQFYKRFIEPLPPEAVLVVVDYHV